MPGANAPSWEPRYVLTPAIARSLMEIEAARAVVEHTFLPAIVQEDLRRRARLRSTHYSTGSRATA
jgi:cell filamentation protein, protein adenylyltransferase